jgi:SAM-dependent methyltransferase
MRLPEDLTRLDTAIPFGFAISGCLIDMALRLTEPKLGSWGQETVSVLASPVFALWRGPLRWVDMVAYSAKADLEKMFDELLLLYSRKERVPDDVKFPRVRPKIDSYEFPGHLIDWTNLPAKAEEIRSQVRIGLNRGSLLGYKAPWTSLPHIAEASLDLIFSQAVLEHVDDLEETYQAMFAWLKPGGYASHVIDFTAHGRSPFWNGHWAYSDWQWRLVRGKREFLLNREPLSTHLLFAKQSGL